MGVFSKLFGGNNSNKEDHALINANYIETILKHSEDQPLGVGDQNVIYAGYNELGGYYYLQTYIVGKLNTKTKTGATLLVEGDGYSLNLKSDMDEIESDPIDIFKGNSTRIDFEIEKDTVEKIKRSTIKSITLNFKKNNFVFTPILDVENEVEEENI
ncbi:hypothetical protein [Psychroserpens sp. NJDZ02]|uniref:hypothetical protein n=1 Tax=Psychroserpens sp. NJDZ02 TaxID=2570561 RepID=UPI0010A7E5C8|nr:hypothetical protein [Psychroserpens sp. NJDZ02]QCE40086.1 hypothetical protein E9099_01165 [Psychroserpens sp. NJDZ02]